MERVIWFREMKNLLLIPLPLMALLSYFSVCCQSTTTDSFLYSGVESSTQCDEKGGYWYNKKCWKTNEEEGGILSSEIDSIVSDRMKMISKAVITMGEKKYPILNALPLERDEDGLIIVVYGEKEVIRTLVFVMSKQVEIQNGKKLEVSALLYHGNVIGGTQDEASQLSGIAEVTPVDKDRFELQINGSIEGVEFSLQTSEAIAGAGNSFIEVKENQAYLSGNLGTKTYSQIRNLIANHPKVKTLVMLNVPGSVNDLVNMHTGRLLRENSFTTKVLSNSRIASGGVDLFCAGKKRIVEKGAKLGIHSWCCIGGNNLTDNNFTATQVPKDHPAHRFQLEYFTMMLGKKGDDFYFHTLSAAPFDGMHYMTPQEIKEWGVSTEFVEN